jgi:predicted ester cyclase
MRRARGDATLSSTLFQRSEEGLQMGEMLDLTREAFRRNDANDIEGFVAMQAADCEWQTPDGPLQGRDAVREYVGHFRRAFPEGRHTIVRSVESGHSIAVEGHWRGTHTGTLATPQGDVPATGKTVEMTFALFVEGDPAVGEASRVALYMDNFAMAAQLGLIPEPQAAAAAS